MEIGEKAPHSKVIMRRGGTWVQRWRVPLGFLFGAGFMFLARPTPIALAIGVVISMFGLALRAWASGHIRKNSELAVSGPYAYTRNPLYLGSAMLALGAGIAARASPVPPDPLAAGRADTGTPGSRPGEPRTPRSTRSCCRMADRAEAFGGIDVRQRGEEIEAAQIARAVGGLHRDAFGRLPRRSPAGPCPRNQIG